ncbi:PQQ-dependent sugar dehydrogenase [Phragmitibacter flavus]|uniref:PQQ-dependent sugar dehydrogenase n=1 Tax=Phragmitibacter flavus TaxID=2576071 RepID=UPI0014086E6F|nr:PQQ-dependent sugar dehydrogenase [Phragmitibacter flavus]
MMKPFLLSLLFFLSAFSTTHAQLVRVANTTLNLPAELPSATGYITENALGSLTFSSPIDVASPPGVTNRLFVIERNLGIQIVDLDTMTKSTFLPLKDYLDDEGTPLRTESESGILSLAFHPNYNQNGYFYIFYSLAINNQLHQRVTRFTASGTPGNFNAATVANEETEAPLITQRDEAGNHNGGDLAFGPDGYLYISVGDEGPQNDGADNARRIAKDFFGAILRIDVDKKPGSLPPNPHDESSTDTVGDSAITADSYAIPPDNPFLPLAQGTGDATYNGFTFPKTAIRTEFYAIGFRNPWRMSFDPQSGRLFCADVGQNNREEINLITPGFNGGWSWREGLQPHTPALAPFAPPEGWTSNPPIYDYGRTANSLPSNTVIHGTSVTGGLVYRGDRLPELAGKYLFCDYNSGFIVALTEQPDGTWAGGDGFGQQLATDNGISGWGYDPRNGDALLCDITGNEVKRLARSGTTGTEPPATLSATGAFSDLTTLTPNPGLVAYAPNVDFWSDHATKSRWFAIRNLTDTITFSPDTPWTFPTGMVWVKHFDINTTRGDPATSRRLETRFLIKTATDIYGLTYKWREDQSDADLVPEEGQTEPIPASSPTQTWRYPSRNECRTCHTPVGGYALSFNTQQMNRFFESPTTTQNQIAALSNAGYFSQPVTNTHILPALAAADDQSASLEWRVRSYLEVNCVQCHQPGGPSTGSWDARSTTPTDLANLIRGPLVNDGGDPTNRFSIPGDTARSMILKRLRGDGVPRMPPLATTERDLAAEQLLTDWINLALPSRQSYAEWQQENFPTPDAPNSQPGDDADNDGTINRLEFLLGQDPLAINPPWQPTLSTTSSHISLTFEHPANRTAIVETSLDLMNWTPWNVPTNTWLIPANTQTRTLTTPIDGPSRFFRIQLSAP